MVRDDGRAFSEVYVLTVTCYAVDATVGRCAECVPRVLTSLADCFFCVCLGFIDGYLSLLCRVMFVHDVALIFC